MNNMEFVGTLNSEETMGGTLLDGRHVFVEMLSLFSDAPEEVRDAPEYWLQRIERGDFADEEKPPMAWIVDERGKTVPPPIFPGYPIREDAEDVAWEDQEIEYPDTTTDEWRNTDHNAWNEQHDMYEEEE